MGIFAQRRSFIEFIRLAYARSAARRVAKVVVWVAGLAGVLSLFGVTLVIANALTLPAPLLAISAILGFSVVFLAVMYGAFEVVRDKEAESTPPLAPQDGWVMRNIVAEGNLGSGFHFTGGGQIDIDGLEARNNGGDGIKIERPTE